MNQRTIFGVTRLLVLFVLVGLLFASASIVCAFGPDTDLSNADASFWGEDAGDWSGWSVASAGDVNGDGADDFLIGAPYDDEGGTEAGQTYLLLGTGPVVGWETYRISKVRVFLPWIVLAVILIGGAGWYIHRRRMAQS